MYYTSIVGARFGMHVHSVFCQSVHIWFSRRPKGGVAITLVPVYVQLYGYDHSCIHVLVYQYHQLTSNLYSNVYM
jgi:hypothetical protein